MTRLRQMMLEDLQRRNSERIAGRLGTFELTAEYCPEGTNTVAKVLPAGAGFKLAAR